MNQPMSIMSLNTGLTDSYNDTASNFQLSFPQSDPQSYSGKVGQDIFQGGFGPYRAKTPVQESPSLIANSIYSGF
jgi:hypothetical protein